MYFSSFRLGKAFLLLWDVSILSRGIDNPTDPHIRGKSWLFGGSMSQDFWAIVESTSEPVWWKSAGLCIPVSLRALNKTFFCRPSIMTHDPQDVSAVTAPSQAYQWHGPHPRRYLPRHRPWLGRFPTAIALLDIASFHPLVDHDFFSRIAITGGISIFRDFSWTGACSRWFSWCFSDVFFGFSQ